MSFAMVDVGGKAATRRRAVASGRLRMSGRALRLLRAGKLPKGDALAAGELAGILAAKNAPALIPLCHPLPLDQVRVRFSFERGALRAECEAQAHARTGVEMEALAGVAGALLAVYDLVKQVEPDLTMDGLRLESKEGGKTGLVRRRDGRLAAVAARPLGGRRARVLVASDRASRGTAPDRSGPLLVRGLRALGAKVEGPTVLPDERGPLERALREAARRSDLVVVCGGTGLGPRDVTPEAVRAVCERLVPGFGEALRAESANPHARLSRSVAGQLGRALVVGLPGSRGAAAEGLALLARLAPHAIETARGADHGGRR